MNNAYSVPPHVHLHIVDKLCELLIPRVHVRNLESASKL